MKTVLTEQIADGITRAIQKGEYAKNLFRMFLREIEVPDDYQWPEIFTNMKKVQDEYEDAIKELGLLKEAAQRAQREEKTDVGQLAINNQDDNCKTQEQEHPDTGSTHIVHMKRPN